DRGHTGGLRRVRRGAACARCRGRACNRRDVRPPPRRDRPLHRPRRLAAGTARVPPSVPPGRARPGNRRDPRPARAGRDRRRGRVVTRLEAYGISLEVPPGWEGSAFRRDGGEPTVHVASFRLPSRDGEFGTRATGVMPRDGLFLAMTEYRVTD